MKYLLFILTVYFTSCSTLNTNHNQNLKAFARSAKSLSVAPGKLYQNISDYRYDLRLIESSVVFTPEVVMNRLNKMVEAKAKFDEHAVQINYAASLIDSYAECLLALTDDSYVTEWKDKSDELSLRLSSAVSLYNSSSKNPIPVSVGEFVGGVVSQLGSMKLKQLQKKYLKNFVDTGSLIINDVCNFFTTSVSRTLDNEISTLNDQFDGIMNTFYDKLKDYQENQKVNPYDYFKYYNPMYLSMKERLNQLQLLQKKTIASMKKIQTAHDKLKASVDVHTRSEMIEEIKELYAVSNQIKDAFSHLKN